MTGAQQLKLLEDLTPVCETGNPEKIKEVMDRHFYNLRTARSTFCVRNETHERSFLPETRDFGGKGYLHSFLHSRRIMTMKNFDEGGTTFEYTYTISFDTQFPSYLRKRWKGEPIPGQDDALTECLRYLVPYRSGIDMLPYLFENHDRLDTPQVAETLAAFFQFREAPDGPLKSEGRIESTINDTTLADKVRDTLTLLAGRDWKLLADYAKRNWATAYVCLLLAATVHLSKPRESSPRRMVRFLELLDEIGPFPKPEIHFVHAFFERGNQERFFRQIQANGRNLLEKLRNMAWDLAHPRTVLNHSSTIARVDPQHADFVVPYILTFDQPLRNLLSGYQANALITYFDDGVKAIAIYPMAVEQSLSEGLRNAQHLLTPERKAMRLERGRKFFECGNRHAECIQHAESLVLGLLNPPVA